VPIEHISDFQLGLNTAAKYLLATASDFQQTVDRLRSYKSPTSLDVASLRLLPEEIILLRGQAFHIVGLPKLPDGYRVTGTDIE
jgi:hypothetical protein